MKARSRAGFSVVEAMVAAALAGLALAGLTAVADVSVHGLRLARDTGTALALAGERLERLRLGPRADGNDVSTAPDGTRFVRTWTGDGGRGRPAGLRVRVAWGRHALALDTEAMP